jgi:hypothetical protein
MSGAKTLAKIKQARTADQYEAQNNDRSTPGEECINKTEVKAPEFTKKKDLLGVNSKLCLQSSQ